jgi:hypothetical protein
VENNGRNDDAEDARKTPSLGNWTIAPRAELLSEAWTQEQTNR